MVTSVALPAVSTRVHHVIDYLGTGLIALSATSLVLFTSLGGSSYPWDSPFIIGLVFAGVLFAVLFLLAERRAVEPWSRGAVEPIIPLPLFANRVFSATSAIGFVAGFAMFGGRTFLPLFFQDVRGVSAIHSGLRLFPLMGGLLVASIGSGLLVSRWGRYKVFPVVGTALMTIGFYLMSLIGVHTSSWSAGAYMAVSGFGLGLILQVLTVAVQNAVPYEALSTATSGVTFFRSIGGSFGTAVFDAVFANRLMTNVLHALHLTAQPHGLSLSVDNPDAIRSLPTAVQAEVIEGIAHTIQTMFLIGVPIAFVAFLLSWTLPEVPLRLTIRDSEPAENLGLRSPRNSLEELQRILERTIRRENRHELYEMLASRAGLDLPAGACCLLYRVADRPDATVEEVATDLRVDPHRLSQGVDELEAAGLIACVGNRDRPCLEVTVSGEDAIDRLTGARRDTLNELLEGWEPDKHPEVVEMIRELAQVLMADDDRLLADARAS